MRGVSLVVVLAVATVVSAIVTPVAAHSTTSGATRCDTSKRKIASDLRREKAVPVARGMRARHVVACRGKWAVVTRPKMGDASFNARYARGKWRFYAGYPMGPCGRAPAWLCPTHP